MTSNARSFRPCLSELSPWRSARYWLAIGLAIGFAAPAAAQFKKDLPPVTCATVDSIGIAEMTADGTITLHLKSLWPDPHEDAT